MREENLNNDGMDFYYQRREKEEKPVLSNLAGNIISTEVFRSYWEFAFERQKVMWKRINNERQPWTYDKIIQQHRFTNVFRVEDRVSQYLIKNVIYEGDQKVEEVFFRIILFKIFNKIFTWESLKENIRQIKWSEYDYNTYNSILDELFYNKKTIYSAAYLMPSANRVFNKKRKHSNHLKLIEMMMAEKLPSKISESKSMEEVYNLLLSYPSLGNFLAFQYTIDINYSNISDFDENDFVIAGPGAKDGIIKCFEDIGNYSYEDIIRMVCENQDQYFKEINRDPVNLFGRKLKLIDCQNLFCEIGKYARVKFPHRTTKSNRTRIKQKYLPKQKTFNLWFPPKWHLNENL